MNGNGRALVQGAVPMIAPKQELKLQHIQQNGPTAAPVVVNGLLPAAGGVQALVSFGGLTKLEALAGQIAGHMTGWPAEHQNVPAMAAGAVNLAQAVLDECHRRQNPTPEASA